MLNWNKQILWNTAELAASPITAPTPPGAAAVTSEPAVEVAASPQVPETSLISDPVTAEPVAEAKAAELQPLSGDALTAESFFALAKIEGTKDEAGNLIVDPITSEALNLINTATSKEALAQGLTKLSVDLRTELANEVSTAWNEQQEASRAAIREAYKGETLAPALASANEVAKTYGGDDMIKLLKETGTGNSPIMLKFLLAVKAAIPGEGVPISGSPTGTPKSKAERMFQT